MDNVVCPFSETHCFLCVSIADYSSFERKLEKNLKLILLLWLAFHAVGMAGAIIWDNMPLKLGAVHAGDWLMKMVFMAIVLSIWHKKQTISQETKLATN